MVGTSLHSIGNNWANDNGLFSEVVLGVGPVNITLGKGQNLLQWKNNIGNILFNGYGLLVAASGGNIKFDVDNLSFVYKGGFVDKYFPPIDGAGFSPYMVSGNSKLSECFSHEIHHLWHSRALYDSFLINYGLQGLNSLIL